MKREAGSLLLPEIAGGGIDAQLAGQIHKITRRDGLRIRADGSRRVDSADSFDFHKDYLRSFFLIIRHFGAKNK